MPGLDRNQSIRPHAPLGRVIVAIAGSLFAALLIVAWAPAWAQAEQQPREGPYFHIASSEPGIDRLPLKGTQVEVRIVGPIADVRVTQHYRNEGQRPIEATYVFPGSTGAAVHAMTVRLGERVLDAQIREKQRARLDYDAAKKEGKTAALLDQHRPNVFQMNVANILPGDDVAVELRYTELLLPAEGRYRFVYPTVVGPRYHVPGSEGGLSSFPATAHLPEGTPSTTAFDLHLRFASPLPVHDVVSSSHRIEVQAEDSPGAEVALAPADDGQIPANRDFILEYRLAGGATAGGLTLYPGRAGEDGYFLALIEPPRTIETVQINPREYIFVVDISGSMHGFPLDTAKTLLRHLIGGLRASDRFNVMLFAGSNRMLADASVPATHANAERAVAILDKIQAGGSTEIVPALERIAALPKTADLARTVVVITDGYVTVEERVFQLVRGNLGRANVFAFGIGSSVNRHLIEGIARAGQGEPFIVTRPEFAAREAERLRRMIEAPVLTSVRAHFEGLDVYDLEPARLDALPDVLGARPVALFGKWRGEPRGQLVLQGQTAQGDWQQVLPVTTPDPDAQALRLLWARRRIQQLGDEEALIGGNARRDAITALGLRHSLLTQYTSFIAVDQIVRKPQAALDLASVNHPLPLPQGVSNHAVGAAVPSTPEPAAWLALLVTLGLVGAGIAHVRRHR
ncbi:MAG: VIT domain-containing protein [Aquincola sp.]|nr:VIT domain-containing protein [Aquincola sp.]MDH4290262.1 VIT domain-containing protein [Aquincola sp.]MDH5329574.1 VIT domain-containing protein [Aquincola sp.]